MADTQRYDADYKIFLLLLERVLCNVQDLYYDYSEEQSERCPAQSRRNDTVGPDRRSPRQVMADAMRNARAGPSRLIDEPRELAYQDRAISPDESGNTYIPRNSSRGTANPPDNYFDVDGLIELDDQESHNVMSLLGPPVQPLGKNDHFSDAKPYWGISRSYSYFFDEYDEDAPDRVADDPQAQANVERYHKLKQQGMHFNESLMTNQSFKNPHVYSQLVSHLGIDETRSNLPALDTGRSRGGWRSAFPFNAEELAEGDPIAITKRQEEEAEARDQEKRRAQGKRNIDFVSSTSSTSQSTSGLRSHPLVMFARTDDQPHGRVDWKLEKQAREDAKRAAAAANKRSRTSQTAQNGHAQRRQH